MKREPDEECLALIASLRDWLPDLGRHFVKSGEMERLLDNLEARMWENNELARHNTEMSRALERATRPDRQDLEEKDMGLDQNQERDFDQVTTRIPKLRASYNLARDIDALADELTLLRGQNDEFRNQIDLQPLNDGGYRAELLKAALRIVDDWSESSKLYESAEMFLRKSLDTHG